MASHLLDEVQKVCSHFCILRKGYKLHEGLVSDTLGEINKVEIASSDMEKLELAIAAFEGLESFESNGSAIEVILKEGVNATDVNNFCFEKGIVLKKLLTHTNTLEQEFLKILREND
jgi:ABC-2 type transport system ATP-binding protein